MSDILFYDEWENFIKSQERKSIKEFIDGFCNDQMRSVDENIEKWHVAYLEMEEIKNYLN